MVAGARIGKTGLYWLLGASVVVTIWFWWFTSGTMLSRFPYGTAMALAGITGLLAIHLALCLILLDCGAEWVEQEYGFHRLSRVRQRASAQFLFLLLACLAFMLVAYWGDRSFTLPMVARLVLAVGGQPLAASALLLYFIAILARASENRLRYGFEASWVLRNFVYAVVLFAFGLELAGRVGFGSGTLGGAFAYYRRRKAAQKGVIAQAPAKQEDFLKVRSVAELEDERERIVRAIAMLDEDMKSSGARKAYVELKKRNESRLAALQELLRQKRS